MKKALFLSLFVTLSASAATQSLDQLPVIKAPTKGRPQFGIQQLSTGNFLIHSNFDSLELFDFNGKNLATFNAENIIECPIIELGNGKLIASNHKEVFVLDSQLKLDHSYSEEEGFKYISNPSDFPYSHNFYCPQQIDKQTVSVRIANDVWSKSGLAARSNELFLIRAWANSMAVETVPFKGSHQSKNNPTTSITPVISSEKLFSFNMGQWKNEKYVTQSEKEFKITQPNYDVYDGFETFEVFQLSDQSLYVAPHTSMSGIHDLYSFNLESGKVKHIHPGGIVMATLPLKNGDLAVGHYNSNFASIASQATGRGALSIYDSNGNSKAQSTLPNIEGGVSSVYELEDGTIVAVAQSGSTDNETTTVIMINGTTYKEVKRQTFKSRLTRSAQIPGNRVAIGLEDSTVSILNSSGDILVTGTLPDKKDPEALMASADGKKLVVGSYNQLQIYDLSALK
jgi:hypothetical protein